MRTHAETLQIIAEGKFSRLLKDLNPECEGIVRNKLEQIPDYFFEPRFNLLDGDGEKISIIEFSLKTMGMSEERKSKLMEKYSISAYDVNKLQAILNSIKVASEYGSIEEKKDKDNNLQNFSYGIALSTRESLDKAYPLWVAYLYSDSKNPLQDVKDKLERDGMERKYSPEYIVSLIEHTNSLLVGKTESEKKDFYMHSISGILDENDEMSLNGNNRNSKLKIDFER